MYAFSSGKQLIPAKDHYKLRVSIKPGIIGECLISVRKNPFKLCNFTPQNF